MHVKIAYFDCFSGISGDMCLGALVDAGVPLKDLEKGLNKLKLKGYELREQKVLRAGIAATKVEVILKKGVRTQESEVRRWKDIQKSIRESTLQENIKKQGLQVFKNLFEAEAKVHGKTITTTHLHELGCVDCLVDIFGTLIGLSLLGIEKIYASPINTGSGFVKTAHGMLPVPAPATAELIKGIACYSSGPAFEMTTPTGAALLKTLSSGFGNMPAFALKIIGNGAGGKDPEDHPNLLRIMIGQAVSNSNTGNETVTVIETNIDDMNPQIYEYVMKRLFDAGALDVFLTQVIMKKSRPGVLLTVLCCSEKRSEVMNIILKETTTIGLRFYEAGRIVMNRRLKRVSTQYGTIRVKESRYSGLVRITPEYEDCKKAAEKYTVSLRDVIEETQRAAQKYAVHIIKRSSL